MNMFQHIGGVGKRGWMTMEHAKFLMALEIEGKGHWKAISTYIDTKSSKQVQSHAQKYFLRQKQEPSTKKKTSIHDFDYEKLEELFNGHYLNRLKISDPSTYHLFLRYRKAMAQKNVMRDEIPNGIFGNFHNPFNVGFQMNMYHPPSHLGRRFPSHRVPPNAQRMQNGMNMKHKRYQEKLKKIPILDPKGRELISRDCGPNQRVIIPNGQKKSNNMVDNKGGKSSNFIQCSGPQNYVQYDPNEDFKPVNAEDEYFLKMQEEEQRLQQMFPQNNNIYVPPPPQSTGNGTRFSNFGESPELLNNGWNGKMKKLTWVKYDESNYYHNKNRIN